jgi:hypothetical protein
MDHPTSANPAQGTLGFPASADSQVTSLNQLATGHSLRIAGATGVDRQVRVLQITAHQVGGHAEVAPVNGGDPFLVWDFDLDPVAQSFAHTRKFYRA